MALRPMLFTAALVPAAALAACGEDAETAQTEAETAQGGPGYDDGAMDPGGEAEPAAAPEETPTASRTARGGDAVTIDGETTRGPAVEAVSRRFDLTNADTIILPTLYRAQADITSAALDVERSQGDLGYITVTGSVDPDAVLDRPRDGLAFELTEDRVTEFLGEPVIITFVARMGEDWEGGDQRPALRAAWVEPGGETSGWRTMNLTEDWQKAVFAYDQPQERSGTHVLTVVPPSDQPVDIAAVAIRAQGAADVPDPGAAGDARQARPMRPEALDDGESGDNRSETGSEPGGEDG